MSQISHGIYLDFFFFKKVMLFIWNSNLTECPVFYLEILEEDSFVISQAATLSSWGNGYLSPEGWIYSAQHCIYYGCYTLAMMESKVKSQFPDSQRTIHFNFSSDLTFSKSQTVLLRRNANCFGHETSRNFSLCFVIVGTRWYSGQLFLLKGVVVWLMLRLVKDKGYWLIYLFSISLLSPCWDPALSWMPDIRWWKRQILLLASQRRQSTHLGSKS